MPMDTAERNSPHPANQEDGVDREREHSGSGDDRRERQPGRVAGVHQHKAVEQRRQ